MVRHSVHYYVNIITGIRQKSDIIGEILSILKHGLLFPWDSEPKYVDPVVEIGS